MIKYSTYVVVLLSMTLSLSAQKFQPVLGLHGGVNFSLPKVIDNFEMVTLLNGEDFPDREYDPVFQNFGNQIGFSFFVSLNDHFSVGLLPDMATYSYGFSTELEVLNTSGEVASLRESYSESKINYIQIPLAVNYYLRTEPFTPYLTVGGSYGIKRGVQHLVEVQTTDYITDDFEYVENNSYTNSNTDEFITSKFNIFGGIGAQYDLSQLRLALDISYWMGLHNIVNESTRFNPGGTSAQTYAIQDDLTLDHLVINLHVLFPINKVENFGALDCTPIKKRKK